MSLECVGFPVDLHSGIGLIIEHRYYGDSFPVVNFTTDNLRWLTTDQAIADIAYFAQNVKIPGHEDEDLTAPGRPWIICMYVLPIHSLR